MQVFFLNVMQRTKHYISSMEFTLEILTKIIRMSNVSEQPLVVNVYINTI